MVRDHKDRHHPLHDTEEGMHKDHPRLHPPATQEDPRGATQVATRPAGTLYSSALRTWFLK